MMEHFQRLLGHMMRARFPFIHVLSWEEGRALETIKFVAENSELIKTKRQVFTWSLLHADGKYDRCTDSPAKDLLSFLSHIEQSTVPSVFVIMDIHYFFTDNSVVHELVRGLKMIQPYVKRAKEPINIIFLSATAVFPRELEKEVSVIDFPLPSRNEIEQVLDSMIEANEQMAGIQIDLDADDKERLVQAALGLTLGEAENAYALAMVKDGRLSKDDVDIVLEEKRQIIKRSNLLEYIGAGIQLDEVGGLDQLKSWLGKRNGSWSEQAVQYGLTAPKGVLLTGVPGCGKSLVAKAVSSLWKLPLLRLDVGKLFGMWIGTSEANIRSAIQTAEAIAPCVLWIDEIEKGFRGVNSSGDSGAASRVFGTFLTWMQEKTKMVFVIATANDISNLPPEMMRKGRFDEIFFVDLPNREERKQIVRLHLHKRLKRQVEPSIVQEIVEQTEGFSGAELEQVIVSGFFEAFAERRVVVLDDILLAIRSTVPLSVTQAERIQQLRSWAEMRAIPATSKENLVQITRPGSFR
ncbi:AAA family ATPase [Paenibacillus ginsengarvi]|nr:AAA family ATPase [Paenibacillus ginsengarvi]